MTVPCPHCAQEVSLEDAGRFACPHCGQDFEAVNEPAGPPPPPPEPPRIPTESERASIAFNAWQEALLKKKIRFVCAACGTAGNPMPQDTGCALNLLGLLGFAGCIAAFFVALFANFVAGIVIGLLSLGLPLVASALSNKGEAPKCRACRSNLVPINSPGGFKLWEKFHRKEGQG